MAVIPRLSPRVSSVIHTYNIQQPVEHCDVPFIDSVGAILSAGRYVVHWANDFSHKRKISVDCGSMKPREISLYTRELFLWFSLQTGK
jgi:hypothetical protein